MKGLIGGIERVTERVSTWLAELAAVSALLLTVVVTYSVIMRFVFNSSLAWTDELATYCLLWMVFFGLTYTLYVGAHIRIDFFTVMLSKRGQRDRRNRDLGVRYGVCRAAAARLPACSEQFHRP